MALPAPKPRMMLALSSRSPNARNLLDKAAQLAIGLEATLFVVHVKQPTVFHYRMAATEYPVPKGDLAYAKKVGRIGHHRAADVRKALVALPGK